MGPISGGVFALYSLLCRHGKFSLLPNQQAADEELSTYKYGPSTDGVLSSSLKRFLEKHKKLRTALLIVVLFGACMVIGDGVLTPAISGKRLKYNLFSFHFFWDRSYNIVALSPAMFHLGENNFYFHLLQSGGAKLRLVNQIGMHVIN